MDIEESYVDIPLNRIASTQFNALYYINFDYPYKTPEDELVNYFYKEMLKIIVEKVETSMQESVESIPSGDRTFMNANLDYIQVCDDDEHLDKEPEVINITFVRSQSNIVQIPSKRRTTSLSKRDKRSRRKTFKSKKKIINSTITAPKYSAFTSPSQLRYNLEQNFEEYITMKFTNGNVYTGSVLMKMFHGVGEYRWSDGTVYKGDFVNGEITGSGIYTYTDLSIYEGEVFKSYPHGFGKYFLQNSNVSYSGYWYLGMKQGTGSIHFDHNNWYEGAWKRNFMEGTGIRHYSSGSKYQGEFLNGKRHGNGCAVFSNNDLYTGAWERGKRSGYGQYIWKPYNDFLFCIPVRNIYNGMWKYNCMHGKGELNFGTLNGCRYIGEFCFNQKHGGGIIICENGTIFDCTPMFADNKPIQYTEKGSAQNSKCDETLPPASSTKMPEKSKSWIPELFEERDITSPRQTIRIIESRSDVNNAITKIFEYPDSLLHKQTLASINLCKMQFRRKPDKFYPIKIPLWVPPENIDLNPFIRPLLEMIHGCEPLSKSDSFFEKNKTWEDVGVKMTTQKQFNYNYQEIYNIEEKAMRRAIHINLRRLREIYKQYSLIGCLKNVPYETLMNRLFLWQMYRDCKISEKGVSLSYIDVMLAEDSISFSESIHDPFENIYFWQFLTTLVKTAWEVYGSKTIKYVFEGNSILEAIFTKFLNEDIFPNVGHHLGTALFDYKDIMPLKSVYNWYRSIEEPMSIKTFILNIFSLNRKESFDYEPLPEDFYMKDGVNISVGHNVVFLGEDSRYCIGPKKEKVLPFPKKCLNKKLYFLRDLGMKFIYKKIRSIIPGIFINNECFNHEYKLCFLEFYEILLTCTQYILRRKELKFDKKSIKASDVNDNGLLKIITSKKSKQYRKSASHHSIMKRPNS